MARLALGLSIFAFLVPLGIAAIVLGHTVARRDESGTDATPGNGMARAALWIAYLQLALVSIAAVIAWGMFHEVAEGFQRDALVQRVFRSSDQLQMLDAESAREAEATAQRLVSQLIAIEDQAHRRREDGSYVCQLNQLLDTGLEGSTDAEKVAFAERVAESPYLYAIHHCNPIDGGSPTGGYVLTAVPRTPRMPEGSAIFCTDQTGVIRSTRGGISLDCLKSGEPVR